MPNSKRSGVTVHDPMEAAKLRAMALALAIKCVPIISPFVKPDAKMLMHEAEQIEKWLRKASEP